MKCFVLNGWAASERAWDLCRFRRDRIFSYIEQLDGCVEKELDACGGAVLVGWSMGGSSALRLMLDYPEKIKGLVLVATTPRMMEERESGWRGMSPRRLEALHRAVELTHGEGFFPMPAGRPNPYMADCDENLRRGLRYLFETDLRARLKAASPLKIPAEIFQAERDGIVRAANAEFLAELFLTCKVTMVPGTEHALSVEIPHLIDDAVARVCS
jgi:pimeloyl-ACP methyl ester carboxylesterase